MTEVSGTPASAAQAGLAHRLSRLPRRGLGITPRFALQRFLAAWVAIWGAVTMVFFMVFATGSPATLMVGGQASKADIAAMNTLYGFDRPIHEQYLRFLGQVVRGDFPPSLRFDVSPFQLIGTAMPYSLLLVGSAALVGVSLGLWVGYLAVQARSWLLRELPMAALTAIQSVPVFVTGLLAVLFFSLRLGWFPTSGSSSLRHLVLPAMTLALLIAPPCARLFRTSLLQQKSADHVRTALAKDIPLRQVLWRHEALNAMVPVISLLGMQIGTLLAGAVLTETVFGWPGLGTLIVSAVGSKDYPVILAAIVIVAALVSLSNFAAELLIAIADPRTAA